MKRLWSLSACALLVAATGGHATDVPGLYEARVPVFDRSDAELAGGAARALGMVVVKLTGAGDATRQPALKGLLAEAKRLIQQFGYEYATGAGTDESKQLLLRVEFDAEALNAELRRRGVAVWGKERPDTLVWLVVDDAEGRRLAGSGDAETFSETAARAAAARGIPLLLPLGDIGETSRVASTSTWPELAAALLEASAPYQTEAALIGYLRQQGAAVWEVEWLLASADGRASWHQEGDNAELIIEEGIDSLADALGRRYADAAVHAQTGEVEIAVHGVRTVDDYARVQRYLTSLDAVSGLSVIRVQGETVVFGLAARGGGQTLAQSISFGTVLVPAGGAGGGYRLIAR